MTTWTPETLAAARASARAAFNGHVHLTTALAQALDAAFDSAVQQLGDQDLTCRTTRPAPPGPEPESPPAPEPAPDPAPTRQDAERAARYLATASAHNMFNDGRWADLLKSMAYLEVAYACALRQPVNQTEADRTRLSQARHTIIDWRQRSPGGGDDEA